MSADAAPAAPAAPAPAQAPAPIPQVIVPAPPPAPPKKRWTKQRWTDVTKTMTAVELWFQVVLRQLCVDVVENTQNRSLLELEEGATTRSWHRQIQNLTADCGFLTLNIWSRLTTAFLPYPDRHLNEGKNLSSATK